MENIVDLIAEYCATNHCRQLLDDVQFIVCADHHFKLAVKDIYEDKKDLIEKVRKIMNCMSCPMRLVKHRGFTYFGPVKFIKTHWSSIDTTSVKLFWTPESKGWRSAGF